VSKFFPNRAAAFNIVAAILMIILLVLQCAPFWQYGENQASSTSIQGYVWFPSDQKDLEAYLRDTTGVAHDVHSILAPALQVLVIGIVGVVLCLAKADQTWPAICPVACGGCAVWGYLTNEVLRLGCNWPLHLLIGLMLVAIGILSLGLKIKELKGKG